MFQPQAMPRNPAVVWMGKGTGAVSTNTTHLCLHTRSRHCLQKSLTGIVVPAELLIRKVKKRNIVENGLGFWVKNENWAESLRMG